MAALDEKQALLDNILEKPADLTSRLIYADYLEEYGDEKDKARAELIRVQIELEPLEAEVLKGVDESKLDPLSFSRLLVLRRRQAGLVWGTNALAVYHEVYRNYGAWRITCQPLSRLDNGGPGSDIVGSWANGFLRAISLPERKFSPEFVRQLFTLEPVEQVILCDRVPFFTEFDGRSSWYSMQNPTAVLSGSHWLPWDIFHCLPVEPYPVHCQTYWDHHSTDLSRLTRMSQYRSSADADLACSRSCVNWARKLVGLPFLWKVRS